MVYNGKPYDIGMIWGKTHHFRKHQFFSCGTLFKTRVWFFSFFGGFPLVLASGHLWTNRCFGSLSLNKKQSSRWWQLNDFLFSPLLGGRFPFWLIFCQGGWNHQLENLYLLFIARRPVIPPEVWCFRYVFGRYGTLFYSWAMKKIPGCLGYL